MRVEVRIAQASAVIVQHVPPAANDQFVKWQRGIAKIAEGFAGYAGTDIYPPGKSSHDEWVIVQHFDDDESLQHWLSAPVRERWIDKIQAEMGQAHLTSLQGGFAAWFTKRMQAEDAPPPDNLKMALSVLLGLYPTVMLLTLYFPGPYLNGWGLAVSMLISNALSVSILQWGVMPVLNRLFDSWLRADRKRQPRTWYAGLTCVLVALAGICVLFRAISS